MRRLSISLLNKIENDVNRITCGRIEGVQGIWCPAIRLDVSRITPEFEYPSVPKPASADDLLQAAALIWAHRDAISIVQVPFLEPLPLGPQNAFIDA